MAEIIYEARRHNCYTELIPFNNIEIGSIAKCSCGNYFRMRDDQLDGRLWGKISPEEAARFEK